jgi:hypothetical protein
VSVFKSRESLILSVLLASKIERLQAFFAFLNFAEGVRELLVGVTLLIGLHFQALVHQIFELFARGQTLQLVMNKLIDGGLKRLGFVPVVQNLNDALVLGGQFLRYSDFGHGPGASLPENCLNWERF